MPDPRPTIHIRHDETTGRRRRWIERATLWGLGGSVLIHLMVVLIASLVTVRFTFADAGGSEGRGVEFALLDDSQIASDTSSLLQIEHAVIDTTLSESPVDLELLSETGQDRSVSDLSESIAPSLDPGGAGLTSVDETSGSAGAGSGDGASFFGLEAKGTRFAYIVDISSSMRTTGGSERSRWDLTRAELSRSLRTLEPNTFFHVQLYSSGSRPLVGGNEWMQASPANKRYAASALAATDPDGATEPTQAFRVVFGLEPRPDAIYYMTDGEVNDAQSFAVAVRQLNGRERIPVHCILFGDAGSPDARQRVESLMRNIARQSGGRFTHVKDGRP